MFRDKHWQQKKLSRVLKLLSTFADFEFALAQRTEEGQLALLDNQRLLFNSIPNTLKDYLLIADQLSLVLPENIELFSHDNTNHK